MNDIQRIADAITRETLIELTPMLGEVNSITVDCSLYNLVNAVQSPDAMIEPAALPPQWADHRTFAGHMETLKTMLHIVPIERRDAWLTVLAEEAAKVSRNGDATRFAFRQIIRRHGDALPLLAAFVAQRYPRDSYASMYADLSKRDTDAKAEADANRPENDYV